MRVLVVLIALLGLAGCGKEEIIDKNFLRERRVSTVTTNEELAKLRFNWSSLCFGASRQSQLVSGVLCKGARLELLSDQTIAMEFSARFFNHGVLRPVESCSLRDENCFCTESGDRCHVLLERPGQCQLTVKLPLQQTVRETTTGLLGTIESQFLVLGPADIQLNYLDPVVENTEVPTETPDFLTLADAAAAKYHCQRFHRAITKELSDQRMQYSVSETTLWLTFQEEIDLRFDNHH